MDRRPERGGHRIRLSAGQDPFPERGIALRSVGLLDHGNRRSRILAKHTSSLGESIAFVMGFDVQTVLQANSVQHGMEEEGIK